MPLTPYAQKLCLDWLLGGAAATQPGQRWVSLGTATPTATSAFDGMFTPRMSLIPGPANSPAGSVSNSSAMSCTVSGVAAFTAIGVNIYDSGTSGTRLIYGGIAAVGCKSGDNAAFSVGAFKVVLD